jgi:hypothetical protein
MDVLRFVFSGFWTFAGCFLLLAAVCEMVVEVAKAFAAIVVAALNRRTPDGGK